MSKDIIYQTTNNLSFKMYESVEWQIEAIR